MRKPAKNADTRGTLPDTADNSHFIEDLSTAVRSSFWNGYGTTIPDNVIHWKYDIASISTWAAASTVADKSTPSTLDLNEKMLQGIAEAMNASYTLNGVVNSTR